MQAIQLIVGLGNPGVKYERTRHNVGSWLIKAIINVTNATLKTNNKFYGQHGSVLYGEKKLHLLIPHAYMNLSGSSVREFINYYNIPVAAILIAHDELDLAPGAARLKFSGGAGGHNGVRHIIDSLNNKQFWRIRFGIGHPGNSNLVSDYVLHPPSSQEVAVINQAISAVTLIVPRLVQGELFQAQQWLHTNA